jgi:protein involved in polysaccharide export with SLBB domain
MTQKKFSPVSRFSLIITLFFFLWSSLSQTIQSFAQQAPLPYGQQAPLPYGQQPIPPTGLPGPQPGIIPPPAQPGGLPYGLFPFLTDVKATPGDTFVDLKWTPFWKEEISKPSRPKEIDKLLESRVEESISLKEKQLMQMPGIEKAMKLRPEEKAKLKTEELEKTKEKIPEEKEVAGYIIYYGKDSKTYTNQLNVGNVTSYRLRGLNNYSTYFFAVQAYTKISEFSDLSKEVSAMPKEEKDLLSPIERSFFEEKIPQVIPREIKQFAYDFFLSKVSSFAPIADVPVGPDYLIGPGDAFTITLWGRIEASFVVEVDRNGEISLPKAGVLKVWGLTFSQLQKFLFEQISKYYKDFQMNVTMERLRTFRVFVVGEAHSPGNYILNSLSTVYHALIAAGGPSKTGSMRNIQLLRNGKVIETIDLYDFFLRGDRSRDVRLQSGDTIFIPVIGPTVGISGNVKRPAIYELKEPIALKEFIEMSGGVTFQGYLQRVQVERVEVHQKKVAVDFDISPEGKTLSPPFSTLLRDGDFVKVFPIYHQAENIVFLEGHVKSPGGFELKKGMKLSDLIPSFDVLLPEPYLGHAEIQRLLPPDRKLQTISFNLGKLLEGDERNNISLENQDRVIIFAKSTLKELPQVSIGGEVQAPGKYRLMEKMRIKDLIYQAGNLKRSAYLQEAEITRLIKTEKEVISKIINIDLNEALQENLEHNILLQEDDRLFVRQIPKWYVDKTISMTGEVKFPGVYTFSKGERLSSVLERAGGFTSEAYLYGAFFTRESVRKEQQKRIQEFVEQQEEEIIKETARATEGALSKEEAEQRQKALTQRRELIIRLKAAAATGRIVIKLMPPEKLKGSEYDLELEEGDSLHIPITPSTVMVMGRVYNPNAILYAKDRALEYYLNKVGGPAENADEKRIYLVKADGSVLSRTQAGFWGFRWEPESHRWTAGGFMGSKIDPGDAILVPEKYERIYWGREIRDWTQIIFQMAMAAGIIVALY